MHLPFDILLEDGVVEEGIQKEETEITNCYVCQKNVNLSRKGLRNTPLYGELSEESCDDHWIKTLNCVSCGAGTQLLSDEKSASEGTDLGRNLYHPNCPVVGMFLIGRIWSPVELLKTSRSEYKGLKKVETYAERIALFVLSQVIFQQDASKEASDKVTFLSPGPQEYGKIYWKNGEAAAFYTLKLKGSAYTSCSYYVYHLPVIDLVYVRDDFRRQGLATAILTDVIHMYPDEDIGLSEPVSEDMLLVVAKYLQVHVDIRDHIWEVSWTGCDGFKTNIWFLVRRLRKDKLLK